MTVVEKTVQDGGGDSEAPTTGTTAVHMPWSSLSVSSWLATSTSRHWATYQSPSCHTVAVKLRLM